MREVTPRQREILGLMMQGYTIKQIALELRISEGVIDEHIQRMKQALGVRSRWGLYHEAVRQALVEGAKQ